MNRELTYVNCYTELDADVCERDLQKWFYISTQKTVNFDNPKSLNEKIQWLKLYDSTPEKTKLADKLLVREWIKETIGEKYLIKSLGSWDTFDEIEFDQLPDKFVLKANHGCGWNLIVTDKGSFDLDEAKQKMEQWLVSDYSFNYGHELHYLNIPPKIIAEEYIEEIVGYTHDYRFYCFNGKPELILFEDVDENGRECYRYYDLDWNILDFQSAFSGDTGLRERPEKLDEMIEVAKKLCARFPVVRVDLYIVKGRVYFGEVTFTPHNGKVPWRDDEQNEFFGDKVTLPEKNPLPKRVMGKMALSDIKDAAVSVVVPVCNAATHVGSCIESVLRQTFNNVEIVCVNNGSKDSTQSVIESYAESNPSITLINLKTQMDLSQACRIGVEHAKGQYILFMDAHDRLVEGALNQLVPIAEQGRLDVLTYGYQMLDSASRPRIDLDSSKRINQLMKGSDLLAWQLSEGEYISSPTLRLIRKECLARKHLGFVSDSIFDDELFVPMFLADVQRTMCIPDKLYVRSSESDAPAPLQSFQNSFVAYTHFYGKYISSGFTDVGLMLSSEKAYRKSMDAYLSLTATERSAAKKSLQRDYRSVFNNSSFEVADIRERKADSERELMAARDKLGKQRDELRRSLEQREAALKKAEEQRDELSRSLKKAEEQRDELSRSLEQREAALKKAEGQRDKILRSYSYRVGKKVTAIPRAVRRAIRAIVRKIKSN